MMDQKFSGKTVLITGGSSGIGYAAAEGYLRAGAQVYICSRNPEKVQQAISHLKKHGDVEGSSCDITQEDQVQKLFNLVAARFGKLDILVNSAGLTQPGGIDSISLADFRFILDSNLTSTFLICKYALPFLKQTQGKIVNVASVAGRFRSAFSGVHYTSAKAGVLGLTR